MENEGIIDKGEFDRAENAINDCRRGGHLPIDFCAEDASRVWENVEEPTKGSIEDLFRRFVLAALNSPDYFSADWWKGEEYYIQMLVEKVDLKSLFSPVCKKYHIPIANASGWSDLNERNQMALRFKAAKARGQTCVLLYCRDFDPWGHQIGDKLRKNLEDIEEATGYDPSDLVIDHFGLKKEFIEENHLTWIDNLISGSGKDMSKSSYCYKCEFQNPEGMHKCSKCGKGVYVQPPFVKEYIAVIGKRKCEANALVVAPQQGRQLARDTIEEYLGHDSVSRFEAKRNRIRKQFQGFRRRYPTLFNELESQLLFVEDSGGDDEKKENDEED